jgi:pilus assembly protein CpaE
MYDYVVVDVDKRLDDLDLGIFDAADYLFVVLTADLSCLKNVRLVLETLSHIGYESERIKLLLNRSNAFTGINATTAEGALKRPIDLQVLNEYRGAISALNSGSPVMLTKGDSPLGRSLHDVARAIDKTAGTRATAAVRVR